LPLLLSISFPSSTTDMWVPHLWSSSTSRQMLLLPTGFRWGPAGASHLHSSPWPASARPRGQPSLGPARRRSSPWLPLAGLPFLVPVQWRPSLARPIVAQVGHVPLRPVRSGCSTILRAAQHERGLKSVRAAGTDSHAPAKAGERGASSSTRPSSGSKDRRCGLLL